LLLLLFTILKLLSGVHAVFTTVGKKFKSLWDKYLLDQLAFASVLLPPLAVSLIFLTLGYEMFPKVDQLFPTVPSVIPNIT
jgi:hypothetical protein